MYRITENCILNNFTGTKSYGCLLYTSNQTMFCKRSSILMYSSSVDFGEDPVSYTHLDVYKRQVYYVIGNKVVVCC